MAKGEEERTWQAISAEDGRGGGPEEEAGAAEVTAAEGAETEEELEGDEAEAALAF